MGSNPTPTACAGKEYLKMARKEAYRFTDLYTKRDNRNTSIDYDLVVLEKYAPDFPNSIAHRMGIYTYEQAKKLNELKEQISPQKRLAIITTPWQEEFQQIMKANADVFMP